MLRHLRTSPLLQKRGPTYISSNLNLKLQFSTKAPLFVGRSPSARDHEFVRRQQLLREGPKASVREPARSSTPVTWPIHLIEASSKSDGLPIESLAAVKVLEDFRSLGRKPTNSSIQELCTRHKIEPLILTLLAKILQRSKFESLRNIVQDLYHAASEVGDPSATVKVIKQGIKSSLLGHPDVAKARKRLLQLVEDKYPTAMNLQACIYEIEGRPQKALQLYEEVIGIDDPKYIGIEALYTWDDSIAGAWREASRLRYEAGDKKGAEAAFEKGAFKYDDPDAFYYLAKLFKAKTSKDYLIYMLKAASSGIPEAAHEVGMYFLKHSQDLTETESTTGSNSRSDLAKTFDPEYGIMNGAESETEKMFYLQNLDVAQEWFIIGGESGIPASHVFAAILLRRKTQINAGLKYLDEASKSKDWDTAISWLKARWLSEDFDFLALLDVNALQMGKIVELADQRSKVL